MDLAVSAILGVSDPSGRILVRPGQLHQPALLARAQVNTRVTALRADGLAWEEHGADTPRFPGPVGRLLLEGQRTNLVTNPRGGISGGTATPNQVVADTSEIPRMIPTVAVSKHIRDTATSDTNVGQAGFVNAFGQPLTTPIIQTIYVYLPSGVNYGANPSVVLGFDQAVIGDAVVGANFAIRDQWQRISRSLTARNADTNPGFVLRASIPNGAHFYATAPQREYAGFASTPILPPVGTPGASTRGTDIVTAPLASLGIGGNGACTILWSGIFDATNIANQQVIAAVDDGSNANRHMLRLNASGVPEIIRVTDNIAANAIFGSAAVTPGAALRAGCTIDGAGRLAGVFPGFGGGVLAVTGGASGGLTTLRLGSGAGAIMPVWAQTTAFRVLPYALPDAALPGAVAALPGG